MVSDFGLNKFWWWVYVLQHECFQFFVYSVLCKMRQRDNTLTFEDDLFIFLCQWFRVQGSSQLSHRHVWANYIPFSSKARKSSSKRPSYWFYLIIHYFIHLPTHLIIFCHLSNHSAHTCQKFTEYIIVLDCWNRKTLRGRDFTLTSWFERNSVHHDGEDLAEKFSHGGGSRVEAIYIIKRPGSRQWGKNQGWFIIMRYSLF